MSVREIIEKLPSLTSDELRDLGQRIEEELAGDKEGNLRVERIDGRLVLVGPRTTTQEEVEAILHELP